MNYPARHSALFTTWGEDGEFDYMAPVQAEPGVPGPPDMTSLAVPASTYAVFRHPGHISTIRDTMEAIWTTWLPQPPQQLVEAPILERYGPEFDPRSGYGGLDVWMPLRTTRKENMNEFPI